MNIYVARDGQTNGPYTDTQVKEYLDRGVFLATDQAIVEGGTNWRPIREVVQSLGSPEPVQDAAVSTPLVPPAALSTRRRGVYIVLGIFLGLLGVHNFYAGRIKVGAFQAIFFLLTAWTVVGALLEAVFVIYELCTVAKDGEGQVMGS